MANPVCRLILFPLVFVAGALAGSPDFTALERAVSKLFVPADALAGAPQAGLIAPGARPFEPGPQAPGSPAQAAEPAAPRSDRTSRLLVPLYVSFAALQGLDVHSTLTALDRGARETNPVMGVFVDRPVAFVALKAGTAAGILFMAERVRRHSPLAAVLMMAAVNSAYATVVANNYRVVGRLGAR
jgi:hypothetical protein